MNADDTSGEPLALDLRRAVQALTEAQAQLADARRAHGTAPDAGSEARDALVARLRAQLGMGQDVWEEPAWA
jgi:multidrug resistance efflux pump